MKQRGTAECFNCLSSSEISIFSQINCLLFIIYVSRILYLVLFYYLQAEVSVGIEDWTFIRASGMWAAVVFFFFPFLLLTLLCFLLYSSGFESKASPLGPICCGLRGGRGVFFFKARSGLHKFFSLLSFFLTQANQIQAVSCFVGIVMNDGQGVVQF